MLESMHPFMTGGHMIAHVSRDTSRWNEIPAKFEPGTANVAGVLGLQAALQYMDGCGRGKLAEYESQLTQQLLEELSDIPLVTIVGPGAGEYRTGVVSFSIAGIHPHDVAEVCSGKGVCIRAGQHCAHPLLTSLGLPAVSRASLAFYNNRRDIEQLGHALEVAIRLFD
jgi:cysteine desulfurase/selenocysteine lyase